MNTRERFIKTMKYENPDSIPLFEWTIRQSTLDAWHSQGLPKYISPLEYLGLEPYCLALPINVSYLPRFEEKILKETDEYKIWVDSEGATRKDFNKDTTPGFVTRKWLEFPVKSREDFLKMKRRFDPQTLERYPDNWEDIVKTLNESPVTVGFTIPFLFWTIRQWMGFENTCMMFYDNSALIEECMEFITDFVIETLKRGFHKAKVNVVIISEDMAYKTAPMISPDMFKKFMLKHYIRLNDYLRSCGVDVVLVDCDGNPGGLIPYWLEAGLDGFTPVEMASNNNPLSLKKVYGRDLKMMGAIDKRVLAKTKKEIHDEVMSFVPELIELGGYIPHTDHAVPPDVPLTNFVYYRELIRKISEGKTSCCKSYRY
jgi:uroporphyrinogen-III decarboxylase